MKLTPVQEKIITSRAPRILVSASAGTGKTTVMVQRIAGLIESGVPVTDMLILAFNRLAAAEMRARISEKLSQTEGAAAATALRLLGVADISTLHSWAANMIRAYFYNLGVSPAFRVMEEKEASFYQKQVLSSVIEEYFQAADSGFIDIADIFSSGRTEKALKEIILSVNGLINKSADPEGWLNVTALKGYSDGTIAAGVINGYLSDWREWLSEEADELLGRALCGGYDAPAGVIRQIAAGIAEDNPPSFTLRVPPGCGEDEKALYGEIREFKQKVSDEFKKMEKYRLSHDPQGRDTAQKIAEITGVFSKKYEEKKRQLNVLDYNDLEQLCLKLLRDKNVAAEVRGRYKYVFVDEYQDINEIQDTIITSINADNLFVVGDIKQSIYAFRLCEPDIFAAKKDEYSGAEGCECYLLNDNFRSSAEILEFNNNIFSALMTKRFGSTDYLKEGMFCGGTGVSGEDVKVIINTSACAEKEAAAPSCGIYKITEHDYSDPDLDNAEKEAQIIAEQIVSLVGTKVMDKEGEREISYGDIAVIFRSRGTYYNKLAEKLVSLDIPAVTDRRLDLINSKPVGMALNLLKCIDNKRDDYALTGLLRSAFYNFSDDELAAVRMKYKDAIFFHEAVIKCAEENDGGLSSRLNAVLSDLKRYAGYAGRMSVSELLDCIYTETSIENCVECYSDGTAYRADLDEFRESMRGAPYGDCLSAYINYMQDAEIIIEQDNPAGGDYVRIMTAHSSKGLEFPVVIYGGAGSQFNRCDSMKSVQLSKTYGLAVQSCDTAERKLYDNALRQAVIIHNDGITSAEELRILYVTLSRARNRLIIVGSAKKTCKKSAHHFAVRKSANPLEWIMRGLKPGGYECRSDFGDKTKTRVSSLILGGADKDLAAAVQAGIDYKYPYSGAAPAKISVTKAAAYTGEDTEDGGGAFIYPHDETDVSLSRIEADNIETGNAYHHIMQYIKTEGVSYNNIEDILAGLVSCGYISERERQIVIPEKIVKCVNSGLFGFSGGYYREQSFLMRIPGAEISPGYSGESILMQGIIDLMITGGDGIVIADYKTSGKTESEMKRVYGRQLDLYARAAESILKKKVTKKIIYSFCSDSLIFL